MKTNPTPALRLGLAVLLAGMLAGRLAAAGGPEQFRLGERAPAFTLKSLAGEEVSLGKPDKSWLVLQFVASWCPISNQKVVPLETMFKTWPGGNVRFLAIDINEFAPKVKRWVDRRQLTFPVLLDEDGKVAASYAPAGFKPDVERSDLVVSASLIIDPSGVIRYFQIYNEKNPDVTLETLSARLKELIAKG